MSSQKLVVGIDFGTSNSGAAYALFEDGSDGPPDIEVIRKWPFGSLRRDASDKVPSEIAYDESGQAIGHGFDMPDDAQPLQWVKLLLEPDHFSGTQKSPNTERVWKTYGQLDRLNKTPVDVIADYLRWLWSRIQIAIAKAEGGPEVIKMADTTVVLTVPASWSDRAKDGMIQAAQRSGISGEGRTLKFRAEPEAAAVLELKTRVKKGQVRAGDCVVICDAGGGTTDVVTYQVRSGDPLSVDQVVVSKGDFCGSAFVDAEFECQLRSILGADFEALGPTAIGRIRDDFEYAIKRTYNPEEPKSYSIAVPGLSDDAKRGIKDGRLKLDDAVLSTSFDTVMTQIMTLLDWQKEQLELKGLETKLKGIQLVGGFGSSDYLLSRIQQEYPDDEGIRVWRGDQAWTAVVQGAVACEISHRHDDCAVNSRLSGHNYGIAYRKGTSRKVQWLIKKGQAVQTHSRSEPFGLRLDDQPWLDEDDYVRIVVSLVKTDDDNASDELDTSSKPHVEVSCRIPTNIRFSTETILVQDEPRAWQIPAELVLGLDGAVLSVECHIQGKAVGTASLQYYDDTDDFLARRVSTASSLASSHRPSNEARDSVISATATSQPSPRLSGVNASPPSSPRNDSFVRRMTLDPLTAAASALSGKSVSRRRSSTKNKSPSPAGESAKSSTPWYAVRTKRDKPPSEKEEKAPTASEPKHRIAKDGTKLILGSDGRYHRESKEPVEYPGLF